MYICVNIFLYCIKSKYKEVNMCLAAPGRIESIDNSVEGLRMAKVSFSGIIKNICIEWIPEAVEGDYVLAHAGTALSVVDSKEAEETLDIFKEWVDGLDEKESTA
jgi:hydrogenase expression/formation protein HypC